MGGGATLNVNLVRLTFGSRNHCSVHVCLRKLGFELYQWFQMSCVLVNPSYGEIVQAWTKRERAGEIAQAYLWLSLTTVLGSFQISTISRFTNISRRIWSNLQVTWTSLPEWVKLCARCWRIREISAPPPYRRAPGRSSNGPLFRRSASMLRASPGGATCFPLLRWRSLRWPRGESTRWADFSHSDPFFAGISAMRVITSFWNFSHSDHLS